MAHINLTDETTIKPEDRNWFIGAYITRELKVALQNEAKAEHRTLSQQLLHILTERYNKERE